MLSLEKSLSHQKYNGKQLAYIKNVSSFLCYHIRSSTEKLLFYFQIRHFHQLLKKAGNTRASEMKISDDSIAELSENYQDCLQRLEIRLKSKGKK